MSIDEALDIFKKKEANTLIPFQYCVVDNGIVINTKSLEYRPSTEPAQYLVLNDGTVRPTNPLETKYTKFYPIKKGG